MAADDYLPDEYDPNYEMRRQQAMLAALRAAPQAPGAQMVGGQYIRPNMMQGIAATIGQWGAAKSASDAMDQGRAAQQRATEDYNRWLANRPQAQEVNLPGPQPEGMQGVPLTGTK